MEEEAWLIVVDEGLFALSQAESISLTAASQSNSCKQQSEVKLERENLVKDWLLDWRFKETELKKLRRRRRLFGKELLMSFSNSQQSLFFFLDLDLAERCREREEGDWLAAKLEKLILALACRCMYEILFYYNIFILKYIKIIFLFLI